MTASATGRHGGASVVHPGPADGEIRQPLTDLGTPGGPVPGPRPPASATPCQPGSGRAGEPSKSVSQLTDSGAPATASRHASVALSPQVAPAEPGDERDASVQGAQGGYDGSQSAPGTDAAALVEAMDGSERTLLLRHLAATRPDVVQGGIAWLAERRAEAAERRRTDRNRKAKDRRRRRRVEGGGNG